MCMCAHTCHKGHVVKGQLLGVHFFSSLPLPPPPPPHGGGVWELSPGHQAWWQNPLPPGPVLNARKTPDFYKHGYNIYTLKCV